MLTLSDEAYLLEVFATDSDIVARTDVELACRNLGSIARAMSGERRSNRGMQRPNGDSALVGTKRSGNSALAYIQPGHYGKTFADLQYRKLVRNSPDRTMSQSPWRGAGR